MKKVLCVFMCLALLGGVIVSTGCIGGGGGGSAAAIFGAILVVAVITASTGGTVSPLTFAASSKAPTAQVRFSTDVNSKFKGRIKFEDESTWKEVTLELSDDKKSLKFSEQFDGLTPGQSRSMRIEVLNAAGTDVIFAGFTSATVPSGSTTQVDPTIDYDSTAWALAYDKWSQKDSHSFSQFQNNSDVDKAKIDAIVTQIKAEIEAKITSGVFEPESNFVYTGVDAKAAAAAENVTVKASRIDTSATYRLISMGASQQDFWVAAENFTFANQRMVKGLTLAQSHGSDDAFNEAYEEIDGKIVLTGAGDKEDNLTDGYRIMVSPSGNLFAAHTWKNYNDSNISIGLKVPSNITKDDLAGKTYYFFWHYEKTDATGNNREPLAPLFHTQVVTFNSDGTLTGADNPSVKENYTLTSDGIIDMYPARADNDKSFMQVSADLNVIVGINWVNDGTDSKRGYEVGVRSGSGMSISDFPARSMVLNTGTAGGGEDADGVSGIVTRSGQNITLSKIRNELDGKDQTGYTENGTLPTIESSGNASSGAAALAAGGELYVSMDNSTENARLLRSFFLAY